MTKQKLEKQESEVKIKSKRKFIVNNNKKYIAIFLLKDQNSYTILSKKRFNPINNGISFRKNNFPIDISNYTYSKGLKMYYLININNGNQLVFGNHKTEIIDTKTIDMILNQKIITDLTSNLTTSNFKMNVMNVIFGALFGGLVGYIIAGFIGG